MGLKFLRKGLKDFTKSISIQSVEHLKVSHCLDAWVLTKCLMKWTTSKSGCSNTWLSVVISMSFMTLYFRLKNLMKQKELH